MALRQPAVLDRREHVRKRPFRRVRVDVVVMIFASVVFARDLKIEEGRRDPAFDDAPLLDAPACDRNRAQDCLERLAVAARVKQRAEQHVAAGAADHLDIRDVHEGVATRARASA